MGGFTTPSDIAREAIRQMAARRLPPTPENYRLLYEEIGGAAARAGTAPIGSDREIPSFLREQIARLLLDAVVPRLGYHEPLAAEARAIAAGFRDARKLPQLQEQAAALKRFWVTLELRGETVGDMLRSALALLQFVVRNFAELAGGTHGLEPQLARMEAILGGPPEVKSLQELDRLLRDAVYQRAAVNEDVEKAKSSVRNLITLFLDRVSTISAATGGFSERVEQYAKRIETASDIRELSGVVANLMADSRGVQADIVRSSEQLQAARQSVQEYEARVERLERELKTAANLVREDPLTGALNRRGLDEAFRAELGRSRRAERPMSLAILDLDNFKQLNDRLGHQAGDAALSYLARLLRTTLRPSDVVARFGGEEFVILLPETGAEEAARVMTRVQRELTRRFFLHDNEKVLITFSAGVAECVPGEERDAVIGRADQAMYEAKRAGKNRVCVSPGAPPAAAPGGAPATDAG